MRLSPGWKSLLVSIIFLGSPFVGRAADLEQPTVKAWEAYISAIDSSTQSRLQSPEGFLWITQAPGRLERVRSGQIVVAPIGSQSPKKVPSGLIHHWIGAVLLRDASLSDVLPVIRNYDHYKDVYRPAVIDSKAVSKSPGEDRFSMLLMNRALFVKSALDADYVSFSKLQGRRFCSTSRTTRLQEIENFGQAGQRTLHEGQGTGIIWRLFSVIRLEQRGEGVYLEIEAVALSRDIPFTVRVFADPIVRRVASSSIAMSLRQTAAAVQSKGELAARVPSNPVAGNAVSVLSLLPR